MAEDSAMKKSASLGNADRTDMDPCFPRSLLRNLSGQFF